MYHKLANKITPPKVKTQLIARKGSKLKKKRGRMKPKQPLFDTECINSKRDLNRLAFKYGKTPLDSEVRTLYYSRRKDHKKLIKSKKRDFINMLTKDIENGNNVDWARFKKLKSVGVKRTSLDVFDLLNFCKFFKNLYTKKDISYPKNSPADSSINTEAADILDKDITHEELDDAVSKTKTGKAVSEDLIANEFLKNSGSLLRKVLLLLFNECLRLGCYPWNISFVTPLHKKGSVYDPNNYRAIAVASNIGKLFSSILLERLLNFRSKFCPDDLTPRINSAFVRMLKQLTTSLPYQHASTNTQSIVKKVGFTHASWILLKPLIL